MKRLGAKLLKGKRKWVISNVNNLCCQEAWNWGGIFKRTDDHIFEKIYMKIELSPILFCSIDKQAFPVYRMDTSSLCCLGRDPKAYTFHSIHQQTFAVYSMDTSNICCSRQGTIKLTGARVAQLVRSLDLETDRNLSPILRGFARGFVNYKKVHSTRSRMW